MTGYLLRRLLGLVPVLLAAATLVFVLLFLLPGDPARLIAGGRTVDPAVLQEVRTAWGLDAPPLLRYARYLGRLLRFDLGTSYVQGRAVTSILAEHIVPTLILGGTATLLAALLGIGLGALAASARGRTTDAAILAVALLGASTPVFWLGLVLILLFASWLRWLPVSGYGLDGVVLPFLGVRLPEWDHLVLPALTLALATLGPLARVTRTALVETASSESLSAARARGLTRGRVFRRHALRLALPPVVTVLGMQLAGLLGGAVATEIVFAWPGLGKALVRAIALRDLPVVEACVLFLTTLFVLASLAVDLLYPLLDPRLAQDGTVQ
ncbi:MAG TPA: ABC transporter permease [Candidatus Polarisedimenticolia bacterium]|jgi:peptide/nickel transport system permease protein|nr:ABC transporter permease [Candidatus Polarisedimenticolia bacterium]